MKLKLNSVSPQPLYQQIVEGLRGMILSGELNGGDPVPSIREMALTQGVSVITVQKAYEELVRMGLLVSIRAKGFMVQSLRDGVRAKMTMATLKLSAKPLIESALREGVSAKEIQKLLTELIQECGGKL